MDKVIIGDIFEISTPVGRAYLHYIYNDKNVGDMIRVLPGLYQTRPINFEEIATSKERYVVFFPLHSASKQGIVEKVGYHPTNKLSRPRFMRTEYRVRGELLGWHIVKIDNWERQLVKELTTEQKQLSPWGIWNDTLLIERLTNGWELEKWG